MPDKKILVVDDEEDVLQSIDNVLSNEGYDVTAVITGEEAINKARTLKPDLILMDIVLPDIEGPDAVRAMNEDPLINDIPVIFLSGIITRNQDNEPSSEIFIGDRRYIALCKPFSVQELMSEVRKMIG